MKKEQFASLWNRFLHWKGWTAWLAWPVWKAIGTWRGWNPLLFPHIAVVSLLVPASAAALIWIFVTGRENTVPACIAYCAAFYALVILCVRIPAIVLTLRRKVAGNTAVQTLIRDKDRKIQTSLQLEMGINSFYGLFKVGAGILTGSAWIGADGLYNLAQSLIQLTQLLRRKKHPPLIGQWKSYRLCGWLMLALHLTMTGLVYQMIHMDRAEEYPGYLIFATALYVFYKLIRTFIGVAKDRRHTAPIDSSVYLLDLSQALFSLFSLQAAMLRQFGGAQDFTRLMNTLTGTAVCLMTTGMGIYMLRRSRRAIKNLEEQTNG